MGSSLCLMLAMAGCSAKPAAESPWTGTYQQRLYDGPLTQGEVERMQRELRLQGLTDVCVARLRARGIAVLDAVPLHDCFVSTPPQRWTGLWRNDFEGSRFCPSPATECNGETRGDEIWLNVPTGRPAGVEEGSGGLYAVDFIGRRTLRPGPFGHLGMSAHEATVERMMSIREIEPPPPPPTEIEAERRRCEAAANCMTPGERAEAWNLAQPR